jgi:nitrate reductase alpha subunit
VATRPTGGWSATARTGRDWEDHYRRRWQHDKVVRSTHGVNCTGSCSWKVYVKDGLITWETQQTDYPSNGPEMPEYEPRGCPRGASFSWYTYSPLRVKHPYVRGALLELYRAARDSGLDPVAAWSSIVSDPAKAAAYKSQRGRGGFVRADWDEINELVAAAHVHTIHKWGPDRIAGFSPIPAMSMASYAGGARFLSLIGGVCLSFYDWYADLPPASPQIWGDQTDVPESADWWDAAYLIMWGSNIPMTRTPDAHFMTEARYRGQKTVVVSPDYSDHTKFADEWLPAQPGTDAALAMAMGHVVLREFYVDRQAGYFADYAKRFTDLPFLVTLTERDGLTVPGRFLRASDLDSEAEPSEGDEWRCCVIDAKTGDPVAPAGSLADRWQQGAEGRWNLELGEIEPLLTLLGQEEHQVEVSLPRFDNDEDTVLRGVPAKRVGGQLVTTVLDLTLAQYGVRRDDLPGRWPAGYGDPEPYTPSWQEPITGVPAATVVRVGREFARNAERTEGRSMIVMGAGTNHWFHSDLIYRAMLNLVLLCGCQGRNGGGWAHYVGQEKVRPITGLGAVAFGLDWARPPRHQAATPYWYLASEQWRYDRPQRERLLAAGAPDSRAGMHPADVNALAARLGWLPSYPTFDRNPLEIVADAEHEGIEVAEYVVRELRAGRLRFAAEDPGAPESFPRVLTVWRSNLLGSSSKGHEYFLEHLLGVDSAVQADEAPPGERPDEVHWRDEAARGKLDLLVTLDFRMNGTCLHSDVVLPAATWYEKEDISTTDLHPFVHAFNAAIEPPWETETDWEIFAGLARAFSSLADRHLGKRRDLIAAPLLHDSVDEIAQPLGEVRDWRRGECEPVPGKTMPKLVVVERDYSATWERFSSLGPLAEKAGLAWKGIGFEVADQVDRLRKVNGRDPEGRPRLGTARQACEAILALSGATNGEMATRGFETLERQTGRELADLATEHRDEAHSFGDVSERPRKTFTSPEWSGIESRNRRYSPFCVNTERLVPFRTLTGRQQLYQDHAWMLSTGEGLATYKPPVAPVAGSDFGAIPLRYLTPHSKWSIHSTYQDNLHMLTLFRGGPVVWLSDEDAKRISVRDNDWVEVYNDNGVFSARAVVSHRIPTGAAIVYHAQDRHVNVPISEISGKRGGTHNSVTRIQMKPTHMLGGYAQLSYGFNYYGPTGSQRDEVVLVRRRRREARF